MVEFVDAQRKEFGVEPICRVLQVAPSTYYSAKSRPPSARAVGDAVLLAVLLALWQANYSVYGTRKLWKAARRAGHDIGRDRVARLMRQLGIQGVRRGRRRFTTRSDPVAARPADLVERNFAAEGPNRLWVTDLTYVATWSGVAYVCFIVDAFSRMIVGWRVAGHMRTDMVVDALDMAAWSRGARLEGLVAHSDAGSQGGFKWSSQRLDCGGGRWGRCGSGSERCSSIGGRCRRRDDRRWRGGRTGWSSGRPLGEARPRRTPRWGSVCHPRLGHGGSVTLAA
jgi:putative transposase